MADGNLLRLGGVSGLLAVVSMIPAYLVGFPDAPGSLLEAQTYFDAESGMFFNGVLPLFHIFFFLLFLGVLYGMLRSVGGEARGIAEGLPAVALAGGIVFATLSAAGFTVEIFYPAVLQLLRRTPIRDRFRARIADDLLMALPLLPDRDVSHGVLHLPGGGRNACFAGLACSGRVRGCTTDVLAFSPPSSGRFGGSGMGGGGLGSDANRE